MTSGAAVTTSTMTSSVVAGAAVAVILVGIGLAFVIKRRLASRGAAAPPAVDQVQVEMVVVTNPVFEEFEEVKM